MAVSRGGWRARDERAVSNVIGVILLIAIKVALAGVFTGFFFGFGDSVESVSPTFAATTDYDNSLSGDGERLVIEHQTGESVESKYLTVVICDARWQDTSTGNNGEAEYTGAVFEDQIGGTYSASNDVELNWRYVSRPVGCSCADSLARPRPGEG